MISSFSFSKRRGLRTVLFLLFLLPSWLPAYTLERTEQPSLTQKEMAALQHDSGLVVGIVIFEASGYTDIPSIQGPHGKGIHITFRNENGEEVSIITEKESGFFSASLPIGNWSFYQLEYGSNRNERAVRFFVETDLPFNVNQNTAANLGAWTWDLSENGIKRLKQKGRFFRIKNIYESQERGIQNHELIWYNVEA